MTDASNYGASPHYDANYFRWQSRDAAAKVRVRAKIFAPHISQHDSVLDFGCAGGALLAALPGGRKIGVEINDVARSAAEQQFGLDVVKTLADVPEHSVDVVVSSHTLEHIASPFEALRSLRSVLKPGGRLVLLLPIDDWRSQRRWRENDINRHLYTWTPMNIGHLLTEAGFQPMSIRVIHRTFMRGFGWLNRRLPGPAYEAVSWLYSHVRHRQELLALASVQGRDEHGEA